MPPQGNCGLSKIGFLVIGDHMERILASRKRRGLALLIDSWLYTSLISITLYHLFYNQNEIQNSAWIHQSFPIMMVILASYALFLAKDMFNGTSPGKYILGIRICQKDNPTTIRPLPSILRNITLIIWPIEGIVMTLNSDKRRIGDLFANSHVIRDKSIPTMHRILAVFAILIIFRSTPDLPTLNVSSGDFTQFTQFFITQSDAFEFAQQKIREQKEIVQLIGEVKSVEVIGNNQINTHNDNGNANLNLLAHGETGDLPVKIELIQESSQWRIHTLSFEQIKTITK